MDRSRLITRGHVRATCASLTLIGAAYLWHAWQIPLGDPAGSGNGGTPRITGLLWVLFGLLATFRARPVDGTEGDGSRWPDMAMSVRIAQVVGLCLAFVVALPFLGMVGTSAIFMVLMAVLCGASWTRAALVAALMAAAIWLVFAKLLQVSFPTGSLLPF